MSHTTAIKGIIIQSITALTAAIAELSRTTGIKMELIPNATPRAYSEGQKGMGKADYVISLASTACPYDIGLYKQPDNSYEPRTDFWAGHIAKIFGVQATDPSRTEQAKLGKLLQMYGIHAAMETARRQGKSVRRVEGKNGEINLVVAGY